MFLEQGLRVSSIASRDSDIGDKPEISPDIIS